MEIDVTAVRPRPWLVTLLAGGLALALALFFASFGPLGRQYPALFMTLYVAVGFGWLLSSHALRGAWNQRTRAPLRIDEAAVSLGPRRVARSDIRDGVYHRPTARKPKGRLVLTGRLGRTLLEAELGEAEARSALHALGLDAGSHRAELRVTSPVFGTLPRQLAVLVPLFLAMRSAQVWSVWYLLPLVALLAWPARITAGVDGFLWRWFFWKRFVPMTNVRDLAAEGQRGVRLVLESGKDLVWYTTGRRKSTSAHQVEHRDLVLSRMRDARAHALARPRAAKLMETVGRNGRTSAEWLEALRTLRSPPGDYRTAALPRDDLWMLLEDPAAPEDARAGAAFLLHGEDGVRLQNTAETTASPQLRAALEHAARGDEAELSSALARQRVT